MTRTGDMAATTVFKRSDVLQAYGHFCQTEEDGKEEHKKLQGQDEDEDEDPRSLTFQVASWHTIDAMGFHEEDEDGDDDEGDGDGEGGGQNKGDVFIIRAFGVTPNGQSVSLAIRGFTPYFFIKIQDTWTRVQIQSLKEFITAFGGKLGLLKVRNMQKKDYYGFRNGKQDVFLRLEFQTLRGMRIMADRLRKPVQTCALNLPAGAIKLYESNIDPLIRFFHIRDLAPAGWITVPVGKVHSLSESTCSLSYGTHWTHVSALKDRHDSAPFIMASFDIECSSSHGDFPVAKKDYTKLASELEEFLSLHRHAKPSERKSILKDALEQALGITNHDINGISRVYTKSVSLKAPLPLLVDDICQLLAPPAAMQMTATKKIGSCMSTNLTTNSSTKSTASLKRPTTLLQLLNDVLPGVQGDAIIQIGVTFGCFGRPIQSTRQTRHIFVLGTCADVAGATVHAVDAERDLLLSWAKFMGRVDPDVLLGYNILGFDMEYIWQRAEELRCQREVLAHLSRLRFVPSTCRITDLSSSALGDNVLKIIDMPGRVTVDLMKVVQRDHKLDSYKLDNVAEHFTGSKKDDVSPADIFRLHRGSAEDRAIIAAYCVQDCELVMQLAWKLETLANNMGMANVCSVPLMFIFMRGQGVKIFSLVAKQCRLDGFVIPVMQPKEEDAADAGYEGAIVLEPQAGIYMEPVSVLDYASLYPSSMISENLSHDSIVLDERFGDVPGVKYLNVCYDIYEGTGTTKVRVGVRQCRYVQDFEGRKGVIPRILENLIGQRKATRKMVGYKRLKDPQDVWVAVGPLTADGKMILDVATGRTWDVPSGAGGAPFLEDAYTDFEKAVLDGLQLAYKVTANSLYGAMGARTNPLYLKDLAACTTATGRSLILKAKDFVQREFGANVIYGDSVLGHTPVLLRIDGTNMQYMTIEQIPAITQSCSWWIRCQDPGRTDKESFELTGIEAWTEQGWTPVRRIIRHKLPPGKRIFRVSTPSGVVDVTEDHSLLTADGTPTTPRVLTLGDPLLHAVHPEWEASSMAYLSLDQARILGMFLGCRIVDDPSCTKGFIFSAAKQIVESYYEWCTSTFPHIDWVQFFVVEDMTWVLQPLDSSHILARTVIQEFMAICSVSGTRFHVPSLVLASKSFRVKQAFMDGFQTSNPECRVSTQLGAATLYSLVDGMSAIMGCGRGAIIHEDVSGYQVLSPGLVTTDSLHKVVAMRDVTSDLLPETSSSYVYDLTTDNGHFAAGIGSLVVHNTDSIFCIFPNTDDATGQKLEGKAALQKSIDTGNTVSKAFQAHLKPPHNLEYEKTFFPFIILSKKRYVGHLYEQDVHTFKQKSMGIVLKRRDNAQIVKNIYGGIIDIILHHQDIAASVKFLKENLQKLVSGKMPMQDLVITKSLRSSYKDPERIAHQVLATRMGQRDPGNRPQASDRIPFVYIVNPSATLQGERIEHPAYIMEKGLPIDYRFYIEHQIMKPINQLYSIVLEQLEGYRKPAGHWENVRVRLLKELGNDIAKVNDKIASLREQEVQRILFDSILQDLTLKEQGQSRITHFFTRL